MINARVQGDSVRPSTGDPVKFDNVDSSCMCLGLGLGGRFAYTANEYVSPPAMVTAWSLRRPCHGQCMVIARKTSLGYG